MYTSFYIAETQQLNIFAVSTRLFGGSCTVGHKATFFPGPAQTAGVGNPSAPASSVPSAVPAINTVADSASITRATASNDQTPAVPRERLVLTTDVLKLTFDTEGGSLVQTEFLKHADKADKTKNSFCSMSRRAHLPGPNRPDCWRELVTLSPRTRR